MNKKQAIANNVRMRRTERGEEWFTSSTGPVAWDRQHAGWAGRGVQASGSSEAIIERDGVRLTAVVARKKDRTTGVVLFTCSITFVREGEWKLATTFGSRTKKDAMKAAEDWMLGADVRAIGQEFRPFWI